MTARGNGPVTSGVRDVTVDPQALDPAGTYGMVTDVQRFSLHDGPGIRTTVFLKGCSLRCFWCHNPECMNPVAKIQVLPERCIGCGACVSACKYGALELQETRQGTKAIINSVLCKGDGLCNAKCPTQAIQLMHFTDEEILSQIDAAVLALVEAR